MRTILQRFLVRFFKYAYLDANIFNILKVTSKLQKFRHNMENPLFAILNDVLYPGKESAGLDVESVHEQIDQNQIKKKTQTKSPHINKRGT